MGTRRLKIDENGRVTVPAAFRRELGVEPGDELIARVEDGELRLTSHKAALERARRIIGRYLKEGEEDLADSLIADRRAEAARE